MMVIAYHTVITAYGFWLPNDPRGSWSNFVRSWELLRFGRATIVDTTCSVAGVKHDVVLRRAAKKALRYPAVQFDGHQAVSIGGGFERYVNKSGLRIWACSILPDHVHLVFGRHRYKAEQVANLLKGEATRRLIADKRHPLAPFAVPGKRPPRCWTSRCWKVFLDTEEEILRAIAYVEANPLKEGLRSQVGFWRFVTPFVPTGED